MWPQQIKDYFNHYVVQPLQKYATTALGILGTYGVWITLHFTSVHLYAEYCVPFTWYGFLVSPFMAASPHCKAMRWFITQGGIQIETMWMLLGTWVACQFLMHFSNMEPPPPPPPLSPSKKINDNPKLNASAPIQDDSLRKPRCFSHNL